MQTLKSSSQQKSLEVLWQCLHKKQLPQPCGDTAARATKTHTAVFFFGQSKRARTLAQVHSETCQSNRTKKIKKNKNKWAICPGEELRDLRIVLHSGQGMKRISKTAGALILWSKWEAKKAQPALKQLLNSLFISSQAEAPWNQKFPKEDSKLPGWHCTKQQVLTVAVLVQHKGFLFISFFCYFL